MEATFAPAKPGRGHRAIASLYRAGKVPGVITQNIDNLHQSSGIAPDDVIELHGNTRYARCIGCGKRYEIDWVREKFDAAGGIAPSCTACDDPIKTATISFGEAMPEVAMQRSTDLAQDCDLMVAIGSSLVVWRGRISDACQRSGQLVILNNQPTDHTRHLADLVLRFDIGETLGPFVGN